MPTLLWIPSALVVATAAALLAIRGFRRRLRGRVLTLEIVIQERRLSPARSALLTDLLVRTRLQEEPPFADPSAFDRCASERLRDLLYRGGDLWREAEELRGLRSDLGFETEEGERVRFLSPILLVAPTGEGAEGVVVARLIDHALVAVKEYPGKLRPGVYLSMVEAGASKEGECAAPVVRLGVWGPYQLVWINVSESAFRARRRTPRIECHVEAEARFGSEETEAYVASTVVNLSRGGAQVRSRPGHDLVPGQQVHLRLPVEGEKVERVARIAWARRDAGGGWPEGPWVVGLEFAPFPAPVWSKLIATVLGKRGFVSADVFANAQEAAA